MRHKHHVIIVKNNKRVRTNEVVDITLKEHAERHRRNFLKWGFWQDELAYKGLLKLMTKKQITKKVFVESGRLGGKATMSKKSAEERSAFARLGAKESWIRNKDKMIQVLRDNAKKYGHLGGIPGGKYIWIHNKRESKKFLKTEPIPKGWFKGRFKRTRA